MNTELLSPDSPRSLKMTINDDSEDMTVSEGDPLTIRCEADGQPTPEMKLERILDNRIVKKGLSPVRHSTTARCDVTDLYTCSAKNQLPGKVQKTSRLDVTCQYIKALDNFFIILRFLFTLIPNFPASWADGVPKIKFMYHNGMSHFCTNRFVGSLVSCVWLWEILWLTALPFKKKSAQEFF